MRGALFYFVALLIVAHAFVCSETGQQCTKMRVEFVALHIPQIRFASL